MCLLEHVKRSAPNAGASVVTTGLSNLRTASVQLEGPQFEASPSGVESVHDLPAKCLRHLSINSVVMRPHVIATRATSSPPADTRARFREGPMSRPA
ncbi:hypothetical protein EVAR_4595_1 [Eumeta japonica]|uniref:Uncharacterized protein n=1 Tax=Eumeta variegata TaxID=151549 RepID=A0A4C1SZM3_EUMVA|nr:hypothetical protein EVAR_4595_1 [Eumeta japonica]